MPAASVRATPADLLAGDGRADDEVALARRGGIDAEALEQRGCGCQGCGGGHGVLLHETVRHLDGTFPPASAPRERRAGYLAVM